MNEPPHPMIGRSFPMWQQPIASSPPPQQAVVPEDKIGFQNPNPRPVFFPPAGAKQPGWTNWKGKKAADRRKNNAFAAAALAVPGAGGINEVQYHQNRVKGRRFYPNKKRFSTRFAPLAPRNTTSFIIRAKRSGGIASLVSPCPVTPAILPTPKFSPSREGLVDMAKEEWGVDGYGSMKGLIRLRSPTGHEFRGYEEDEGVDEGSSDSSDVEEHVEVERRLDQDLSRFEMVYNPDMHEAVPRFLLENWVGDQQVEDSHVTQLEEENLTLRERLFLMEREMAEVKRRLLVLEERCGARYEDNNIDANEEVLDNEGAGDLCSEKNMED